MTDRLVRLVWLILAVSVTAINLGDVHAAEVSLPERAPLPAARPDSPTKHDSQQALPAAKPPIPKPRPRPTPDESAAPETEASPAPPIEGQPLADAERACRASLRKLGVGFEERPPESEAEGCVIAHPIAVTVLSHSVKLEPDALLKCAMAETSGRFISQVAEPAAKKHLGSSIKTVRHASAYVCRPRNGSAKLSEHAFGNALDISAFELADGRVIEVSATVDAAEQEFLNAIRKAACGPFKTVLGPGSDADHSNHFHFDLAPRRRGSTFCQ